MKRAAARLALLVAALLAAGCGVTEVVHRAPDGTPILIRSPQPDADDVQELVAEHGVRTVLNLRGLRPGAGWFEAEAEGVRAAGVRWVHLAPSGSRGPTPDEVRRFFALVEDPAAWPILVHCQGGIHRTGGFVALYRIQYQGWDNARAVEEMIDRWFDWTTRDRSALKEWLLRYQRDPAHALPAPARAP